MDDLIVVVALRPLNVSVTEFLIFSGSDLSTEDLVEHNVFIWFTLAWIS